MKLANENIVRTVEEMEQFCSRHKVGKRQCKRISLAIEEILLNLQSNFGSDAEFSCTKKSYLGFPVLRISLKGKPFNPLPAEDEDEYSRILCSLVSPEDTKTMWKYVNGENRITVSVSKHIKHINLFGGSLLPSLLAAIIFALLCKVLPPSVEAFMREDVLAPVFNAMMKLLIFVTGPVIFFSLLLGILAADDLDALKKTGGNIIIRFFVLTIIPTTVCILVSSFVFPWEHGGSATLNFGALLTLILSFVPDSIISPFAENNFLQIVFMALLSGGVLIMLGDRVWAVRELVNQLNIFILRLMNTVSAIIPVLIFVSVTKTLLENDLRDLAQIWKLVASEYALAIIFAALLLLYLFLRRHISPKKLLRHVKAVLIVAFSTASGTAAIEANMKACNDMGVNDELSKLWLPLAHAMFSPSMVIPLVFGTFFMAQLCDVTVSFTWIATLFLLVFQFGLVSPKIPGGIIAVYSVLFVQLGIPVDSIGLLAATSSLATNFLTAYGMLVREFDIIDLAASKGCIDMEKFNSCGK